MVIRLGGGGSPIPCSVRRCDGSEQFILFSIHRICCSSHSIKFWCTLETISEFMNIYSPLLYGDQILEDPWNCHCNWGSSCNILQTENLIHAPSDSLTCSWIICLVCNDEVNGFPPKRWYTVASSRKNNYNNSGWLCMRVISNFHGNTTSYMACHICELEQGRWHIADQND